MKNLKVEAIEYLNHQLRELNKQSIRSLEDRKCNFDVEIGREMLRDYDKAGIEIFALWSGDSDFADPISQLLEDGKKVILFATARRIAYELNDLQKKGLIIFDVQKIRDFICWKKEISPKCKEDSLRSPQALKLLAFQPQPMYSLAPHRVKHSR